MVNAVKVAQALGLGGRTNTIMQTAFFCISGIIKPVDKAIELLKAAAKKAYGKKGDDVVKLNWDAIDAAKDAIEEVAVPAAPSGKLRKPATVAADAPQFVKDVTAVMMRQEGDSLPVSAIPDDGTWPTATTQFEKRNIAINVPEWNNATCIQCLKCSTVCPHAAIRAKVVDEPALAGAPEGFKTADAKPPFKGKKFTIQIAVEDCTGCGLCSKVCPELPKTGKTLTMVHYDQDKLRKPGEANWKFFLDLPETDLTGVPLTAKTSQLKRPLFEFSGACAGCGETPYVKMLTQICGDHLCIANATGCSSIYGGNLPTTPYCQTAEGKGPAWSNSLFEDNAEFGLGMAITRDKQKAFAKELIAKIVAAPEAPADVKALLQEAADAADAQKTDDDIKAQRARVAKIKELAEKCDCPTCKKLATVADFLVRRSVWILGGDGWAYDIGYGGLDHVLATGRNVKILVLDTEVYSNTGGQASKSTPIGAVAKFAAAGKPQMKKDLAAISMTYKNIYVAQISMGMNPEAARPGAPEDGGRDRPLPAVPLQPGSRQAGQEPPHPRLQGAHEEVLRGSGPHREPLQAARQDGSRGGQAPLRRGRRVLLPQVRLPPGPRRPQRLLRHPGDKPNQRPPVPPGALFIPAKDLAQRWVKRRDRNGGMEKAGSSWNGKPCPDCLQATPPTAHTIVMPPAVSTRRSRGETRRRRRWGKLYSWRLQAASHILARTVPRRRGLRSAFVLRPQKPEPAELSPGLWGNPTLA